jgi:hypothetical protein
VRVIVGSVTAVWRFLQILYQLARTGRPSRSIVATEEPGDGVGLHTPRGLLVCEQAGARLCRCTHAYVTAIVCSNLAVVGRRTDLEVGCLGCWPVSASTSRLDRWRLGDIGIRWPHLPADCGFERMQSVSLRVLE